MQKIMMLRGLPASGKSTWAKEFISKQLTGSWKRVNKDELRAMVDGNKWSHGNEGFILDIRDAVIKLALTQGKNVIVDDTNFAPKHEARLRQLAQENHAEFEIKHFPITLKEAIERDLRRPNSVGESVIKKMYYESVLAKPKLNKEGILAVICDLDGTLCHIGDRSPYDATTCENDQPNVWVQSCLSLLRGSGRHLIFTSGRKDTWRAETERWLKQHIGGEFSLFMRKANDDRQDAVVKKEIFEESINPTYTIDLVFDDRNQVVEMWRAIGLQCWQVADGNF